jgi:lipoic acid synthetase
LTESKPQWLTVLPPTGVGDDGENYRRLKGMFSKLGLHTVCEEAHCPNVSECWGGGTATLMLMGDMCSRACRFCMVTPGRPAAPPDPLEPENVAMILSEMGLSYIVLTSVDRDDLPDQGAGHFARTIALTKKMNPDMRIEVLIPDFQNDLECIRSVVEARPDVIAHNIETTMFLTGRVRDPRANYWQSLSVLRTVKKLDSSIFTKSSIMLGLGEGEEEVRLTMKHLRDAGVDFLTLGQYLQPSARHLAVVEYVPPDRFDYYKRVGEKEFGFTYVASGPLVRSSYKAGELFIGARLDERDRERKRTTINE